MPHRGLPYQRKGLVFGQTVRTHEPQHGGKDDAPGANASLQLLDMSGFLTASLGGIEGDDQRRVKSG